MTELTCHCREDIGWKCPLHSSVSTDQITQLERQLAEARAALENLVGSVDDLIAHSEGVAGLHLNGDLAPWGSLTKGGQFEEWLIALEHARAAIQGEPA